MPRRLTPKAQADRDDFENNRFEMGGCSCHQNPPCGYCTHPGNPLNQNEDDEAWEDVPEEHPQAQNFCIAYTPTWRDRIAHRLFPQQHVDAPEMEGASDCIVCQVATELSLIDRIRILFSGRAQVAVKTATEHSAGRVTSASSFSVSRPKFLENSAR